MRGVLERFLKYVKFNTQSDAHTDMSPSTPGQYEFALALKEEMEEIGLQGVTLDENGYLMGFLPSNIEKEGPAIGFIAHLDTSPAMSGKNVTPQIIKNYNGGEIQLDKEKNFILSPSNSPELANYEGQDIITSSGNSLLGADDKAGIAEILTAMEILVKHPEIKHGKVCICFIPDEEIGRGTEHFNIKEFGAKFAYTLDGGEVEEIQYENFNAAIACLTFKGKSFHPGYAKNKLINSITIANEFISSLPKKKKFQNILLDMMVFFMSVLLMVR